MVHAAEPFETFTAPMFLPLSLNCTKPSAESGDTVAVNVSGVPEEATSGETTSVVDVAVAGGSVGRG